MPSLLIGVAGGSGSGKTTVSHAILERVGRDRIAYLQHDAYYRDRSALPPAERARINYDHPDSLEPTCLSNTSSSCAPVTPSKCRSTILPSTFAKPKRVVSSRAR
jgi:ABC-type dipeptide/oligopeptide/nickel transport system ATPase component